MDVDVGPALLVGQMVERYGGQLLHAEQLSREDAAVALHDNRGALRVVPDAHRVVEAEVPDGVGYLLDLLVCVDLRVSRVGHELGRRAHDHGELRHGTS